MTDLEKGIIIAFFWIFQKIAIVARSVGCSWTTVWNFIARALEGNA